MGKKLNPVGEIVKPDAGAQQPRAMSGTGYAYFDLNSSIEVADTIHKKGGGSCTIDQLAAWLGYQTVKSGTFATRLSAARYFFLITGVMDGKISITLRARSILAPVMPEDSVDA